MKEKHERDYKAWEEAEEKKDREKAERQRLFDIQKAKERKEQLKW